MNQVMLLQVVLWAAIAATTIFLRVRRSQQSAGIVMAYIINLWLIHWPAAVIYLLPWYDGAEPDVVASGFAQSLYGIIGLSIGIVMIGPALSRLLDPPRSHTDAAERRLPSAKLPYTYIGVGVFSYLILAPLLGSVPTVAAIVNGTNQLIIVGLCLVLWHAWWGRLHRRFAIALVAACLMPVVTILREGFLSFGAMALIAVITFAAVFVRPRWALVAIMLVVGYVGFSFYVTYMRDRGDIRAMVWGQRATTDRVAQFTHTFGDIEWFNPEDPVHLMRVNARLNQNYLVGSAVEYLRIGSVKYAHGETVIEALQSLVPRAIWPDKPVMAGSTGIVTKYTGIGFSQGTSVGVGQVMEFYINFGSIGVLIGFLIFGTLMALLDTWAAQRLWAGDWLQFALWYLPGLALMQAGGSLVDVLSSVGAAALAVLFVNRYVVPLRLTQPRSVPLGPIDS